MCGRGATETIEAAFAVAMGVPCRGVISLEQCWAARCLLLKAEEHEHMFLLPLQQQTSYRFTVSY